MPPDPGPRAKEETKHEEDHTREQNTKVAKLAAIFQLDEASARTQLVQANWDLQVATDAALALQ